MRVRFAHQMMVGILLICLPTDISQEKVEGCTIGVASGKATADGRPLLWKNRDGEGRDCEVVYCKDGRFKHLVMASGGDTQWIGGGVNEVGFCAVYSAAFNLPENSKKGVNGGNMMKWALKQCVTVDDFESLLRQTNVSGRTTACNIGVIDAFGGAAIFETGNYSYTRFDATDPKVAPQGYIIRATYAFTGASGPNYGKTRFEHANHLWQQVIEKNKLDYQYVLRKVCRDLSNAEKTSYTSPEMEAMQDNTLQVLNNQNAISRPNTTYTVLFHGVRPDENPSLTTFWAILGNPILSVTVPSWVIAESAAPELDGEKSSPICTAARDLYFANYISGDKRRLLLNPEMLPDIWAVHYPVEDSIFDRTESIMSQWRKDYPTAQQVASFHQSMASEAMATLEETIELLVQKGGRTSHLRIALYMRDLEKAKAFIRQGIDVNVLDGHGYTPLHYAVQNDQKEIVQLLISKNADVNVKTRPGQTPLHIASDRGNKDIVKLLLGKGANFNAKNEKDETPLHIASERGNKDIVELLLGKGADVNSKNEKSETPLDIAISRKNRNDAVELLLAKGADGSTIHSAAFIGNLEKLQSIIEAGSDVNVRDTRKRTALHHAARAGHKQIVELLLERGADVNAGAYYQKTAAEFAMDSGHDEIVELLVAKGADISPLHLAIYLRDEAKARSLIENGTDVNKRTPFGTTPLDMAAPRGFRDVVELLIDRGAEVNAKDNLNWTPLHYVAEAGHKEIAQLLIAAGADINAKGNWNWTPLHCVAEVGHKEIAQLLIAAGADINAKDGGGSTPLRYAQEEGYAEIVQLLRRHGAKE